MSQRPKWYTDATYVEIVGNWCYLYRAIDKQGDLVDVYLSDTRDQVAVENFFKQDHTQFNLLQIKSLHYIQQLRMFCQMKTQR
ncbi:MAG: DDE-type integrase/transposase/recombinase [Francisellaceae bacterium]|jgi:transposase-like protein|nr:DDE-type integrase/transposase/recombinase [Francisellaceae bacterium]MBT6207671.1 DDE-type integrase/transposase/recombinase [Francisellaceae bacterium]MBT6538359.1 DDE-type integrase/transposase/recombinase [Francisellaceae bacterium]